MPIDEQMGAREAFLYLFILGLGKALGTSGFFLIWHHGGLVHFPARMVMRMRMRISWTINAS